MSNIEDIAQSWLSTFKPPERITPSEWAEKYRYLSSESSANPGKFSFDMAPFSREWLDSVLDPNATATVLMVASQTSKTESMGNLIGYFIDIDPAPMLVVMPTIDLVQSWSKERLSPMLRDCPRLHDKVYKDKSRDSNSTILFKRFKNGGIAMAGANAASGLASRPRRIILADEVDRYPASASGSASGGEGDPLSLAIRRTESFHNAVVFITSTPTIKNHSRVEQEFLLSDQRYFYVPCPKCNHSQTLKWVNVIFDDDKPEDAYLQCEECKAHLTDEDRIEMVKKGEWIPTYPERNIRGYHLNGIYSLFQHKRGYKNRLHQMAVDNIKAKKGGKETLKTWINTFLAETWEDAGDSMDWEPLYNRREAFPDKLHMDIGVITAGVDIQGDRVEVEIVGHSKTHETWSLQHRIIIGDFNNQSTQDELDSILKQKFTHESGVELGISLTLIDSGHKTDSVYGYTKPRQMQKIFACKGVGGAGVPLVARPTKPGQNKALLFKIGTDTAKELVYSRLENGSKEHGYCHFPNDRPQDYFKQLVVERKVTRYKNGLPFIKFENPSKARNEALDIRVYALAALALLNPDWDRIEKSLVPKDSDDQKPKKKPKTRQRSNWVNGWR